MLTKPVATIPMATPPTARCPIAIMPRATRGRPAASIPNATCTTGAPSHTARDFHSRPSPLKALRPGCGASHAGHLRAARGTSPPHWRQGRRGEREPGGIGAREFAFPIRHGKGTPLSFEDPDPLSAAGGTRLGDLRTTPGRQTDPPRTRACRFQPAQAAGVDSGRMPRRGPGARAGQRPRAYAPAGVCPSRRAAGVLAPSHAARANRPSMWKE